MKTRTAFLLPFLLPLLLLMSLSACARASQNEHRFQCLPPNGQAPLRFAFNADSVWIEKLHFTKQHWIRQKSINAKSVSLVWSQPLLFTDAKTNRAYQAQLFYDYQFDRQSRVLSFAQYVRDLPQPLAAREEKEIKFTCSRISFFSDFLSPLRPAMRYALSIIETLLEKIIGGK